MYRSNGRHRFFLSITFFSRKIPEKNRRVKRCDEANKKKMSEKCEINSYRMAMVIAMMCIAHTKQMLVIVSFLMRAKKLSF